MPAYEFSVKINLLIEADDDDEARSTVESWLTDNVWDHGEIERL